ncbi:hypothetical protein VTH06DRAFT_4786 [Thermothelomyces fergusii]
MQPPSLPSNCGPAIGLAHPLQSCFQAVARETRPRQLRVRSRRELPESWPRPRSDNERDAGRSDRILVDYRHLHSVVPSANTLYVS